MTTSSSVRYTNEITPEFLRTLDKSPFTKQQLDAFDKQSLEAVSQRQAFAAAHPPTAIYRVAAEGSQTRQGGVVKHATGSIQFKLESGQHVRAALIGDHVHYPDGTEAKIVTGAGKGNNNVALVGSYLSNGDEIINTPQGAVLIIRREGVDKAEDFLPPFEDASPVLGAL